MMLLHCNNENRPGATVYEDELIRVWSNPKFSILYHVTVIDQSISGKAVLSRGTNLDFSPKIRYCKVYKTANGNRDSRTRSHLISNSRNNHLTVAMEKYR